VAAALDVRGPVIERDRGGQGAAGLLFDRLERVAERFRRGIPGQNTMIK
jgi:hypothetical protein